MSGIRGPRPYGGMQSGSNPNQAAGLPISTQRPTSSDPCATIAQCLMMYHMGVEEEFSRKAIESLIKKLKDKRDELDALIMAVTSHGKIAARCITIQRTLDGRLQVAGRKGFPHVVYAKIWRWPDLHKNELKHLPMCQCAFDLKCEYVCVNPYHYERVVPPGIGTLDLSRLRIEQRSSQDDPATLSPSSEDSSRGPTRNTEPNGAVAQKLSYASTSFTPPNVRLSASGSSQSGTHSAQGTSAQWYPGDDQSASTSHPPSLPTPMMTPTEPCAPSSINPNPHSCPVTPNDAVQGASVAPMMFDPNFGTKDHTRLQQLAGLQSASFSPQPQSSSHVGGDDIAMTSTDSLLTQPTTKHWCLIIYHEHTTRVGKTFYGETSQVFVDGGIDDTVPGRFCLNTLPNLERSPVVERVREHIGRGILLEHHENGDVYMMNLMQKYCAFAQSSYLTGISTNKSFGHDIHRVLPAAEIKVFDFNYCCQQIQAWSSQKLVSADPENLLQLSEEEKNKMMDIGVDALQKLCSVNISFIKGFGIDYESRKTVAECPCWVEIKISRALQYLDAILNAPAGS